MVAALRSEKENSEKGGAPPVSGSDPGDGFGWWVGVRLLLACAWVWSFSGCFSVTFDSQQPMTWFVCLCASAASWSWKKKKLEENHELVPSCLLSLSA